jgi:hypothetical protein
MADKYHKLSSGMHSYAANAFKCGDLDIAIDYENEATFYENLFISYTKMARRREI